MRLFVSLHLACFAVVCCFVVSKAQTSYRLLRDVTLRHTFRRCCLAHKVPLDCARNMCTYDYRNATQEEICRYTEKCTKYVSEWLYCAMDGKNDITDCLDGYADKPFALPKDCYPLYAEGKAPSLEKVFKNGLLSNTCLRRTPLLLHCYKRSIIGTSHKNVCLQRGKKCKKFSHRMTDATKQVYNIFLFQNTAGCVEE